MLDGQASPSTRDGGGEVQGRFCAGGGSQAANRIFCDDFDDRPQRGDLYVKGDWEEVLIDPADGRLEIAPAPPVPGRVEGSSSPNLALHARLPSGGGERSARLGQNLNLPAGFLRLEVAFRTFVSADALQYARIGSLWLTGPAYFAAHGVSVFGGPAAILDGDIDSQEPRVSALAIWKSCVVILEREEGIRYRSKTLIDGLAVFDEVFDFSPSAKINFFLGAFNSSGDDGEIDLWIDDVTVKLFQ